MTTTQQHPPPSRRRQVPTWLQRLIIALIILLALALVIILIWRAVTGGTGGNRPEFREINENRIGNAHYDNEVDLPTLLQGATQTSQRVEANFTDWGDKEQSYPVERRAILHTQQRIADGKPLNVLVGTQYALSANTYRDLEVGLYAKTARAPDQFYNPVLYLEKRGDTYLTVLVTANRQTTFGVNEDAGTFRQTPEGMAVAQTDNTVWTARQFSKCVRLPITLSSTCLYKTSQYLLTFNGHDQVILTAPVIANDGEPWAVRVHDGSLRAMVGLQADSRQRSVIDNQEGAIMALIEGDGSPFNSQEISELPAYTFGE